ncbi:MAG: hypothetical protein RIK87_04920 [Fuerstiella sp.]
MLEVPADQLGQRWVVQRLYRLCASLHASAMAEPCLEQYERHVGVVMDQEVTEATAAWIRIIVCRLRAGLPFCAEDYLG